MAGQEQLGKYTLLERIGVGGMAEVWLARATGPGGFNKACVVKTVRNGVDEERFRRMFMDEARLAAILNHPNIVQIFDFGEDNGRLYIAMEFILGRTLRSLLKKLQQRAMPFPLEHVARVMGGVLEGLEYAHNLVDKNREPLKIVHRDVSPDNVMISYSGVPKLVDFGIAKATMSTDQTRAGRAKGKLLYMAPEQLTGASLDHRVDVYAAGVVLFELCCGAHPFPITSPEQLAIAIVEQEPPHPQDVNLALPDELAEVIVQCLRKNPEERLDSARAVLERLESFVQTLTLSPAAVRLDQLLSSLWADEMAEDAARARRASDAVGASAAARQASLLDDDPSPDTVSEVSPRAERAPPRTERPTRVESAPRPLASMPRGEPVRTAPPRPAMRPLPPPPEPLPTLPPLPLQTGETVLSTGDRQALERVFESGLLHLNQPTSPDGAHPDAETATHPGADRPEDPTVSGALAAPPGPALPRTPPGHWLVPKSVGVAAVAVAAVIAGALSGTTAWVLGVRAGAQRGGDQPIPYSRLSVSTEGNCQVVVDDGGGQPGPRVQHDLPPGVHTVEAACPAWRGRMSAQLVAGRDLDVVLRPPAESEVRVSARGNEGLVQVVTRRRGTLYVDDRRLGDIPSKPFALPAGEHTVKLVTHDREEKTRVVTVTPGATQTVAFP